MAGSTHSLLKQFIVHKKLYNRKGDSLLLGATTVLPQHVLQRERRRL